MLERPLPHDPFGATVITHPAKRGDLAMVDVLLRHGADINRRSDWWAGSFGVLDMCDPAIAPEKERVSYGNGGRNIRGTAL